MQLFNEFVSSPGRLLFFFLFPFHIEAFNFLLSDRAEGSCRRSYGSGTQSWET